jgi:hypothetical protein
MFAYRRFLPPPPAFGFLPNLLPGFLLINFFACFGALPFFFLGSAGLLSRLKIYNNMKS